jgi:UDP-N-acetylmuramoylalanine--D-glutamate ligase
MLIKKKYQNKRIAIYGMGITGYSTASFCKTLKANVVCWDDNPNIRKKTINKKFKFERFWKKRNFIDFIVISPGIDIQKCKIKNYLKKNFKKIITDLDLFFELNKKELIISITGTNGKSTTCKIIEKILKTAKYNVKTVGNIGNPILETKKTKEKYIYIIEVSSYQLQYSKLFRSKHSAILNISPDHLERHQNIKNYIKIKSRIFFAQKKSDYLYLNVRNKYFRYIKKIAKIKKNQSKIIEINKSNYNSIVDKIKNRYFEIECNTENLAFAYRIAKNLKIKDNIIINSLNKFKGLPHRQEIIFYNKKILCINDSKATSYDACLQSLKNYNKIYWIVGGLPKFKDNFYLKNVKGKIVRAYIIGKYTSFFKKKLHNAIPYTISKNIKVALDNIYKDLVLDKNIRSTILLSPAAASYDQFSNFENRGVYFKQLVLKKFAKNKNV